MRPQELIAKKRDGTALSKDEINIFIDGVCDGSWADYQISALVMAMFIRGLNEAEGDALTRAMLYSGKVLDFPDIDAPKADKHSTGGVGDKTSIIIAPLLAACGVAVPMISGRGLGHTGGTLDKLESIPGYNVNLSIEQFHDTVKQCGFAMAGQTSEIAPADKKLYALRDATATVPYIPLIVASIMSKKLAEGLDALVLDVKTGSGAFMQNFDDAKKLAEALVQTGKNFGVKAQAVVSDMSQPLGQFVGNALEVYECLQILRGENNPMSDPTRELSLELTARALVMTGISQSVESARELASSKITNGDALEKLRKNIEMQGGDPTVCDEPSKLFDEIIHRVEIKASESGFVSAIDTLAIGNAVVEIGGGREKADDAIDTRVGYELRAKIGDQVREGETIGVLYCRTAEQSARIQSPLTDAYTLKTENETVKPQLIKLVVDNSVP